VSGFIESLSTQKTDFISLSRQLFFVLRKKNNQISLLHVYHHSMTPIMTWVLVRFLAGMTIYSSTKSGIHGILQS
jgi:hypothetical protein